MGIWRRATSLGAEEKSDFRSVWRVPSAQRSWGRHRLVCFKLSPVCVNPSDLTDGEWVLVKAQNADSHSVSRAGGECRTGSRNPGPSYLPSCRCIAFDLCAQRFLHAESDSQFRGPFSGTPVRKMSVPM